MPQDSAHAIAELSDLLVGLESVGLFAEGRGRLPSEGRRQAIAEITAMIAKLEANEEKLFQVSLYAQVHGERRRRSSRRARGASRGPSVPRAWPRAAPTSSIRPVWRAPCPPDATGSAGGGPSPARSSRRPIPSARRTLCMEDGVWYGRNPRNNTPLIVDPYAFTNSNSVVIGSSGSGKSAWTKVHLLRVGELGAQRIVIDPGESGEYRDLCAAVGGQVVRLSAGSRDRINPLDLPQVPLTTTATMTRRSTTRCASTWPGCSTCWRCSSPARAASWERGRRRGWRRPSSAPIARPASRTTARTHTRPAPLLADLRATLDAQGDDFGLAERLGRYCDGALSGLFAGRTTVALDNDLTVFELHGVEKNKELRAGLMHLVTQHVWRAVLSERRRRSVLVDEAHAVTRFASTGDFLARLAKQARKHWCETIAASQDPLDFTATAAGRALILNSCRTWLLRCEEVALPDLAQAAHLSEREQAHLLRAPAGPGPAPGAAPSGQGRAAAPALRDHGQPRVCAARLHRPRRRVGPGARRRPARRGGGRPMADDTHLLILTPPRTSPVTLAGQAQMLAGLAHARRAAGAGVALEIVGDGGHVRFLARAANAAARAALEGRSLATTPRAPRPLRDPTDDPARADALARWRWPPSCGCASGRTFPSRSPTARRARPGRSVGRIAARHRRAAPARRRNTRGLPAHPVAGAAALGRAHRPRAGSRPWRANAPSGAAGTTMCRSWRGRSPPSVRSARSVASPPTTPTLCMAWRACSLFGEAAGAASPGSLALWRLVAPDGAPDPRRCSRARPPRRPSRRACACWSPAATGRVRARPGHAHRRLRRLAEEAGNGFVARRCAAGAVAAITMDGGPRLWRAAVADPLAPTRWRPSGICPPTRSTCPASPAAARAPCCPPRDGLRRRRAHRRQRRRARTRETVHLPAAIHRGNTVVLGATGTGKSTFAQHLVHHAVAATTCRSS